MTNEELLALLRKPTITIDQAAKVLGISRAKAYEAARTGELTVLKFGKRRPVPTAPIRRLLGLEA
jgi:excisionase family DNA binding protein